MTTARMATTPTLKYGKPRNVRIGLVLLMLIGLPLLYPPAIRPLLQIFAAQSWVAAPCKILHGEVRSHISRYGAITYSVHIVYEYPFADKTYESDRYGFMGGSSGEYKDIAATVDAYDTMANPVCYVNPKDPSEAALERGFHPRLLIAFIPLALILMGVGGACGMLLGKRGTAISSSSVLRPTDGGAVILEPSHSPLVKLIGATLIALVWNAMAFVFAVVMIRGFRSDSTGWFLAFFLLPFTLVGIGIVISVVYQFLVLFNPHATLELSSPTIPLGGAAQLRWNIVGRVHRIEEFTVTLRGIEEVTYLDGTRPKGRSNSRDRSTFHEMELCRTSNADEIAAGSVGFVIPRETMYSFAALHNKIIWNLDIQGKIAKWPDVKESFKLSVVPAAS